MLETLHKTSTPEVGKSECYRLSLKMLPGSGPRRYYVKEGHGCWDDSTKTFFYIFTTLNTAEECVTLEEAEAIYFKARTNRGKSGFVHSFAPDYFEDNHHEYRLLEIDAQ